MKLEIEVPDFKFDICDVVEVKNERNDKSVFVRVLSGTMDGGWRYDLGRFTAVWISPAAVLVANPGDDGTRSYYVTQLLPGSFTDSDPGKPLDGFLTWNKGELEKRGILRHDMRGEAQDANMQGKALQPTPGSC